MKLCNICFEQMTKQSNYRPGFVPEIDHKQVHSKMLNTCLDEKMVPLIEWMNSIGVKTLFSCQGSGFGWDDQPPYVLVEGEILDIHQRISRVSPYLDSITQYSTMYNIGICSHIKGPKYRTKFYYTTEFPDMEKVIGG